MKLYLRIQMFFMLRRADKLIRVYRSKDSAKIVDWELDKYDLTANCLVAIVALIGVANIIYYWVSK